MSESLNVVGILRSPELRSSLAGVCTNMNGTRFNFQVTSLEQASSDLFSVDPDLVIIEVRPQDMAEVERLKAFVASQPSARAVVATAANASLNDVRCLMRTGVLDVLPQPVQRDDVVAALEIASKHRRSAQKPQGQRGRLIPVLKGGGGVGATTIAVQTGCCLAGILAKRGQAACLLDLDMQNGTAALYLDLDDRMGVLDLSESLDRLDGDLLRGIARHHDSGLSVVAAPRDVMPLDSFTPEFVRRLALVAREQYDIVLADLPPVWSLWSFEVLRQAEEVLLVTQMTVPGVRQARRQLDTLKAEGLDNLRVHVVLNRYEKKWGENFGLKEVERALGRKVEFTIANDYRAISEALDEGQFLADLRKRSKAFKSISKLSEALAGTGREVGDRLDPPLAMLSSS
jgi:pilus assembly protein CpaE